MNDVAMYSKTHTTMYSNVCLILRTHNNVYSKNRFSKKRMVYLNVSLQVGKELGWQRVYGKTFHLKEYCEITSNGAEVCYYASKFIKKINTSSRTYYIICSLAGNKNSATFRAYHIVITLCAATA